MPSSDIATRIYHSALGLLARREHSCHELQQKLLQRFPDTSESIHPVLMRLIDEGYQSDARYVEVYIRSRMNKGFGPQRLRQELRLRGIKQHVIDDAFRRMSQESEGKHIENLLLLWNKKFKSLPKDSREKFRQMNFLRYRGFSSKEIEDLFVHLAERDTSAGFE